MLDSIKQQVQDAIDRVAKMEQEVVLRRHLFTRYSKLMENHAEFRKVVWGRIYGEVPGTEGHRFEMTDEITNGVVRIIEEEIEKRMG